MENVMDLINYEYYNLVRKSELVNSIINVIDKFTDEELYLTGGVLRNTIWNILHNRKEDFYIDDCDIIFYSDIVDKMREKEIEKYLTNIFPYLNWSVKNQARMHIRNGHFKYKNLENAIYCFPETSSAIAINGNWQMIAPYGYRDILELNLRPTTFCKRNELHIFNKRVAHKKWLSKFEMLNYYSTQQKCLGKCLQTEVIEQ